MEEMTAAGLRAIRYKSSNHVINVSHKPPNRGHLFVPVCLLVSPRTINGRLETAQSLLLALAQC